jgi:uncharacterized protein (TIGR00251 family)
VAETPWRATADGLVVAVKLTPRASRSGIEGIVADADGKPVLAVKVSAPPAEGRANAELVKLIAKRCGVAAGKVSISAGAGSRRKRLTIDGDPAALAARLSPSRG